MNIKVFGLVFILMGSAAISRAFAQITSPYSSFSPIVEIACRVSGLSLDEGKYKTIVEGNLQFYIEDITAPDEAKVQESYNVFKEKYMAGLSKQEQERWLEEVCLPIGLRSRLFGNEGGIRLQISAWRCHNGSGEPYFYQRLIVNGMTLHGSLSGDLKKEGASRLILNTDRLDDPGLVSAPSEEDLILEQEPIEIPEGRFKFLYSDCKVSGIKT